MITKIAETVSIDVVGPCFAQPDERIPDRNKTGIHAIHAVHAPIGPAKSFCKPDDFPK